MIRQDFARLMANATTGLRALLLLLTRNRFARSHRDRDRNHDRDLALRDLIARQQRNDRLVLGPGEPDTVPTRVLPWLLCQAVLGPGLLALNLLMWLWALFTLSTPLWWSRSEEPVPGLRVEVGTVANAFALALLGLVFLLIAVTCGHGLPRWHARVNQLLSGGRRHTRLERRVEVLTRSRAGALEVQAAELRRIERDLHDGVQQRLVALTMTLGRAELDVPEGPGLLAVQEAHRQAEEALADLRSTVRGIHPRVLVDHGLAAAVHEIADRSTVPATVDIRLGERLPPPVEQAAYFVVSEALTNVDRHSKARRAGVHAWRRGKTFVLTVEDDGVGEATTSGSGTGLAGLVVRLDALGGTLRVVSPPGGPTEVRMECPL